MYIGKKYICKLHIKLLLVQLNLAYLNKSEWNKFAANLKTSNKVNSNNEFPIETKVSNKKRIQQKTSHESSIENQNSFLTTSQELGSMSQKVFPIKSTYQTTGEVISWPLNQIDFASNQKKRNLGSFHNLDRAKQFTSKVSHAENKVFLHEPAEKKKNFLAKQFLRPLNYVVSIF